MIRRAVAGDVEELKRILTRSPEAARWLPRDFSSHVSREFCVWVCQEAGEIIGLVVARLTAGEAEIMNLAIEPAWRRRGVGQCLVETVLEECRAQGVNSVFLEVRESNSAARAFYAALGFIDVGRRPDYYRHPDEAALVLTRRLR